VHGKRSPRKRAERRAAWEAQQEEERRRYDEWVRQQPGYVTDWGKILDDLARWKRERGIT
jgi:hypothetical protein